MKSDPPIDVLEASIEYPVVLGAVDLWPDGVVIVKLFSLVD